jgi:hypothetical protein
MLADLTYTPPPESEAAILPLLPANLRAQALRLLAQLSEHGRYIEKPSRRQSQYQIAEMPPVSIRRQFGAILRLIKESL